MPTIAPAHHIIHSPSTPSFGARRLLNAFKFNRHRRQPESLHAASLRKTQRILVLDTVRRRSLPKTPSTLPYISTQQDPITFLTSTPLTLDPIAKETKSENNGIPLVFHISTVVFLAGWGLACLRDGWGKRKVQRGF
ncbi:uncharacterized protein SPPG_09040 [Spizellomyces punctatus DAOM BR117]|uniref:Uncharacterized protein n=1 Tax=Spizellomyces punctatus (strain DAOM BR117) TaxID=645134 RepID=A0A0L0HM27_SPIPD|nr:uncharacterized protein SPPG_09040 [Spizellomyces punctatus DAOM BR117]KND02098.1 hypothetical protein SPPG_09040 [Spizellomyces punctatus DAOM BR117]|eukprot:XP_016610137.1 hypothetical protein SPPG_09040 [Spizellomyces punctatus DAOM BR117]